MTVSHRSANPAMTESYQWAWLDVSVGSRDMRLFLYGTLLDPDVLTRHSGDPALAAGGEDDTLRGWSRVCLTGTPYPTLRRRPGSRVDGRTVEVGPAALRRLTAYEGPAYRLRRVTLESGRTAWTWIAPGGTDQPWRNAKEFA